MNYIQLVQDIPVNFICQRCGIIPYCVTANNTLLFALAMDSDSGQLTDFGGYTMIRENPIYAALREFHEESLATFGYFTPSAIQEQLLLHNNQNLVIFLHIDGKVNTIDKRFKKLWHQKRNEKYVLENCGIFWCTAEQLSQMVKFNIVYKPVATLLQNLKRIVSLL